MGNAVEANNELGVGFFSEDGKLLSVEFDDVNEENDRQVLQFDYYTVEIAVKKGKLKYELKPQLQQRNKKKSTNSDKAA